MHARFGQLCVRRRRVENTKKRKKRAYSIHRDVEQFYTVIYYCVDLWRTNSIVYRDDGSRR